jgi:hypothetical protein
LSLIDLRAAVANHTAIPNFLLARFYAPAIITKVRFTLGIQRVVRSGEHATQIEGEVMTLIQAMILGDGFVALNEPIPDDIVEVVEGPLRSLIGIFRRRLLAKNPVLTLLTTLSSCT